VGPQRTHPILSGNGRSAGTTPAGRAQPTADRHGPQHRQRTRQTFPTVTAMSLPSSWRAGAAALLLAAPLALSGCSATTSGVPASLAAPVGNGSPIGGPTVDAGRDSLSTAATFVGTVMTSGGFTLYRNTKDKAVPPTSSCLGTCTSTWSPI